MTDFTKEITPEYHEQHDACPKCGETDKILVTAGCCLYEPDTNFCSCPCGWSGIVHDLILAAKESDDS